MPDFLREEVKEGPPSNRHGELHYELSVLEPYGAAFVLSVCDEDGNAIDSFVLEGRYGRLLGVLEDAANERARVEQWRGFLTATTIGERYSKRSNTKKPLQVDGVRALVCELRGKVKKNFARAARVGRNGLPPIIETRTFVGYRVGSGFKSVLVR